MDLVIAMRRGLVGLLALLALFLTGCGDFVPSPIGTNSAGLLVVTLDSQGNYLSWTSGEEGVKLYLTDSQGSFLQEIPVPVETGFIGWPQLTPDGQRVVYLIAEEVHEEEGFIGTYIKVDRWGIHQVDLESGSDERLVETANDILSLQLEPTGERLAYLEVSELPDELECPQTGAVKIFNDFKLQILSLAEPGAQPEEIATGVLAYRWARDGGSLLLLEEEFSWCGDGSSEDQLGFTLASLSRYDFRDGEPAKEKLIELIPDPMALLSGLLLPQLVLDWTSREEIFITLAPPILGAANPEEVNWQLYSLDPYYDEVTFIADRAFYPAVSPDEERLAFIEETDPDDRKRTVWMRNIVDPDVQLKRVAGPGCYSQLFWASEEELGYVEEVEDAQIIWIYNLKTGKTFNLSAALARR